MTKKTIIILLATTIVLTSLATSIGFSEAIKGQGVSLLQTGSSGSPVCGDMLCSEMASEKMKAQPEKKPYQHYESKKIDMWPNVHSNVITEFNTKIAVPVIEDSAFIHPFAIVIGNCSIGERVLVSPTAVCRGDEGTPIRIGDDSDMQDGVVIHALETTHQDENIDNRRYSQSGDLLAGNDPRFKDGYAAYIGDHVSLAHGAMIHGPVWIGNNTFIGMESMIFNAKIGHNVAVGVSSTITGGVEIPDGKFVPPGSIIVTQDQANALPERIGSSYENTNTVVLHVNNDLADGYNQQTNLEQLFRDRMHELEKGMLETGRANP